MASLDVKRPAAQEQLAVLGRQVGVDTLPIVAGQTPVQIARRAEEAARLQGYDVVLLDTAGRTHIDEPLMAEMAEIKAAASPHEILLVADSLTGQDAVNLAKNFDERVGITGIVLTRVDGDGRGGAALSMRAVTGKPIKLHRHRRKDGCAGGFPSPAHRQPHSRHGRHRLAGREGGGDDRRRKGAAHRRQDAQGQVRSRGSWPISSRRWRRSAASAASWACCPAWARSRIRWPPPISTSNMIKRQRAIILSMTPQERRNPDILKASRKKRIAAGSGTKVEDVNRLLKQHRNMADMMKSIGRRQARADGANGAGLRAWRRHAAAEPGRDRGIAEAIRPKAARHARHCRRPPPGLFRKSPPACRDACRVSAAARLPGLGGDGFNPFGKKKMS